MIEKKAILGIDLGTSSVKVLKHYEDGRIEKAKAAYDRISPEGWWQGVKEALSQMDHTDVCAIGLSSQVGTYIVNDEEVISWNSPIGQEEVKIVKQTFDTETFLREISMPHPDVVSYPIPRLYYIMHHYDGVQSICQPKDYLCEKLTGIRVTDPYSWRGLANLTEGAYSRYFLQWLGVTEKMLPEMYSWKSPAGLTTGIEGVLPAGIPVFVGFNDYYASLLGMGICRPGDLFDITGTSEHLGVITEHTACDTPMVSGPYLTHHVHYGVTASSGASLDFALHISREDCDVDLEEMTQKSPPVFLPYLNGERAPIWDADACGMFFGIEAGCSRKELCYAVLEGVAFSLWHIYESMGCPQAKELCIAGGAAVNQTLNRLKAELFATEAYTLQENDTSALGAAMAAGIGAGRYRDLSEAIGKCCKKKDRIVPTGQYDHFLKERYQIYKELYPLTKQQMKAIRRIKR